MSLRYLLQPLADCAVARAPRRPYRRHRLARLRQLGQQVADLVRERWNIVARHRPGQVEVNAEVAMDQQVTHARNLPPLDFGVGVLLVRWQALHRLADDLQSADDGVLCPRIGEKFVSCQGAGVLLNPLGAFEDILQQDAGTGAHRIGA